MSVKLLKRELYKFQRKASSLALSRDHFALFMEQGTGKTITALKVVAVRHRRQSVKLVLVVAPKGVVGSWERQIGDHLNIPHFVINGMVTPISKKMLKKFDAYDGVVFVILNYERAWRQFKTLKNIQWDMMIADEGHRLRARNSRQSKAAYRLGLRARHRLLLTGTPIDQDETELWAQFRYLDPKLLGTDYASFDRKYLRKTGYMGYKRKFKRGFREIMLGKLSPSIFRISAEEALGLPVATDHAIYFDLTGKAKTAYKKMESEFLYQFGDLESTTPLAVTNMLRLAQLAGGHLGMDDKSLLQLEQDKLIAFADWLEDWPKHEKLVIFAQFTAEIDVLAELMRRVGRSYVIRDGRTKTQYDLNAWQRFQDEEDPNVYIAQIASGGIGVDLFRSRVAVFYSKSFSYIDYDQARFRVNRNGQKRPVLFIHMIGKNTIDELQLQALDAKCLTAQSVFTYLRQRITHTMAKTPAETKPAAAVAPAEKKKQNPPPKKEIEFGVKALAESVGIEAGDLRVLLRAGNYAEAYKPDGNWDFKTKKNLDTVGKELVKLQAERAKKRAAAKTDEASAAKTAAKETKAPAAAAKTDKKK